MGSKEISRVVSTAIQNSEPLSWQKEYKFYHCYVVCAFNEHFKQGRIRNKAKSTFLCKKFKNGIPFEKMESLVMKTMAYSKVENIENIYELRPYFYQQIATNFHCLELMKKSHRVTKMVEMINQSKRSKEDQKFFYGFLKLQKNQSIKNVCFVFQHMNGGSLFEVVRQREKKFDSLKNEEVLSITCQLVEALNQFKKKGIIHRNLTPENILFHNNELKVTNFETAFILDYSVYSHVKNGVDSEGNIPTQLKELIGSEQDEKMQEESSQYLYNEQQKVDIFFVGINLFFMMTGISYQNYFQGKRLEDYITKIQDKYCKELIQIMTKCLKQEVINRYSLEELNFQLIKLEKTYYMESDFYENCYLSEQKLNFYCFSQNSLQAKKESQKILGVVKRNNMQEMEEDFENRLLKATTERHTNRYKQFFECSKLEMQTAQLNNAPISKFNKYKQYLKVVPWTKNELLQDQQQKQTGFFKIIQKLLMQLNIKAYYYEYLFRTISLVNLKKISNAFHKERISELLDTVADKLVLILEFIYEMILKRSWTNDENYLDKNRSYEERKNLCGNKNIASRKEFFSRYRKNSEAICEFITATINNIGSQNHYNICKPVQSSGSSGFSYIFKLYKKEINPNSSGSSNSNGSGEIFNAKTGLIAPQNRPQFSIKNIDHINQSERLHKKTKKIMDIKAYIDQFKDKKYENKKQRFNFAAEHKYLTSTLFKIENIIKNELIQTIINLIIALDQLKEQEIDVQHSNIKNVIFMMMVLEIQETDSMTKNDIVTVKEELDKRINLGLGWRIEELDSFFSNYAEVHKNVVENQVQVLNTFTNLNIPAKGSIDKIVNSQGSLKNEKDSGIISNENSDQVQEKSQQPQNKMNSKDIMLKGSKNQEKKIQEEKKIEQDEVQFTWPNTQQPKYLIKVNNVNSLRSSENKQKIQVQQVEEID